MTYSVRKLDRSLLKYAVATLMYCPGDNDGIADKLIDNKYNGLCALALCLEDSIMIEQLESAMDTLENTLIKLSELDDSSIDKLPLIFIRVRNPSHMEYCIKRYSKYSRILNGFVMPKYDTSVSKQYKAIINGCMMNNFVYMPILESELIIDPNDRINELRNIKYDLDNTKNILSILIGTNDMCNHFGIRRSVNQTVYDIGVIRDILSDIVRIFGRDYVLVGPVWEYFNCRGWMEGLVKELELDQLNGFTGKSCIHPRQIHVVNDYMRIKKHDYEDACQILNWGISRGVCKSLNSGRMNEIATHKRWAERIYTLAQIYGVLPY